MRSPPARWPGTSPSARSTSIRAGPRIWRLSLTGVIFNTLGAAFGWALGAYGGHGLLERHGRWLHVTPERIERAERWFERFGTVAVPLGFACPVVRSFVALPAGIAEMAAAADAAARARWAIAVFCAAIGGLGWAVGSSWHTATALPRYLDYVVVAAVIAGRSVLGLSPPHGYDDSSWRFRTLTSRRSTRR